MRKANSVNPVLIDSIKQAANLYALLDADEFAALKRSAPQFICVQQQSDAPFAAESDCADPHLAAQEAIDQLSAAKVVDTNGHGTVIPFSVAPRVAKPVHPLQGRYDDMFQIIVRSRRFILFEKLKLIQEQMKKLKASLSQLKQQYPSLKGERETLEAAFSEVAKLLRADEDASQAPLWHTDEGPNEAPVLNTDEDATKADTPNVNNKSLADSAVADDDLSHIHAKEVVQLQKVLDNCRLPFLQLQQEMAVQQSAGQQLRNPDSGLKPKKKFIKQYDRCATLSMNQETVRKIEGLEKWVQALERYFTQENHLISADFLSQAMYVKGIGQSEEMSAADCAEIFFGKFFATQANRILCVNADAAKLSATNAHTGSKKTTVEPNCLSFFTAIVKEERVCFVAPSTLHAGSKEEHGEYAQSMFDELQAAAAAINGSRQYKINFTVLNANNPELHGLIDSLLFFRWDGPSKEKAEALSPLTDYSKRDAHRACAEKRLASTIAKLFFQFGNDVRLLDSINCNLGCKAQDGRKLPPNALTFTAGDQASYTETKSCCPNCQANQPAVYMIWMTMVDLGIYMRGRPEHTWVSLESDSSDYGEVTARHPSGAISLSGSKSTFFGSSSVSATPLLLSDSLRSGGSFPSPIDREMPQSPFSQFTLA